MQRSECRLDALAWYQAAVLDDDPIGARCVLDNTVPNDLITGLTLLLDSALAHWAGPSLAARSQAVDALRIVNLTQAGAME